MDILIYALLAIECCERVCVFCESIIINSEWSSIGDKFSDVGNAIKNFLTGVEDSIEGTVKGLLTLVADLGILYVYSECTQTVSGYVPEVLDQEVEKIKQKYEPLLKDPVNTIGGIGQSICDTADEKGVAYSSGYIVTEVVTALLADKGLDKLKNVAKTGKTADNVADIAEGAGKAAEDAGKAGKTAGKVGESGINSYADFSKAISDIGMRSDLTDAQKISELQKLFESSNYKADINVPSDIQYVKGFDAKGNVIYDWPPKLGFDESTIQSISRTDSLPDTWDRYGYMGGSNFADVPPTGKYTYSERAIPYVENEAAYHTGTFNNATYFDKIDATYGLKGTAASWGDMSGGAGQYVTPLNGSTMKRLGIIN